MQSANSTAAAVALAEALLDNKACLAGWMSAHCGIGNQTSNLAISSASTMYQPCKSAVMSHAL